MPLILEGLVTTKNLLGEVNLAPMGPIVDRQLTQLTLRPFHTSQTYRNLKVHPVGVLHVTDDVELLARAAVGLLAELPPLEAARHVDVPRLADACRWLEFRVENIDDARERTTIDCRIVHDEPGRPFFGFNRAKHAVVEAAILATRVGIIPTDVILEELQRLQIIVDKTAGDQETNAFNLLQQEIARRVASAATQS